MSFVRRPDGCRIHYEVMGRNSAPPVLMIQGLGADKHGWDFQRLAFSMRYRVIALDNRGSGRSDKPYGDYSMDQMTDDALAVLDDLGIERAHVRPRESKSHPAAGRVRTSTLAADSCRRPAQPG